MLIDGNGALHPWRFGVASHIGVELDIPTVGVAKKLLCGKVKKEPGRVGEYSPVELDGRQLGWAYKSTKRAKPIYISPGHRVSMGTALALVREWCGKKGSKLPGPLAAAHRLAKESRNSR